MRLLLSSHIKLDATILIAQQVDMVLRRDIIDAVAQLDINVDCSAIRAAQRWTALRGR